jgi:predicted nucleic acid-binding protein
MKVFLDTNVLVSAVVGQHESHARSLVVLGRVQHKNDEGFISGHSLAEIYAVLTKLPPPFRHSPEQALISIEENILKYFTPIILTGQDYVALIREAGVSGIQGGTVYDAVLLKCAVKSGAERIYTFNVKHFANIAPDSLIPRIGTP